jgi:hypothetical protein
MRDAMIYCSTEAAVLTPDEKAHLEQLPDAAHEVSLEVECLLVDGHAGAHVGMAQVQDHTVDDQTHWWLQWAEEGGRECTRQRLCPVECGDDICLLPVAHAGEHHWG